MNSPSDPNPSAPLRALRAARPSVEALRTQDLSAEETRDALLSITHSIEGCLRLLQRDARMTGRSRTSDIPSPEAPLEAVFAEVCHDYSLDLDLVSDIDDVMDIRRRVESGRDFDAADVSRVLGTYDRMRAEVQKLGPSPAPGPAPGTVRPPAGSAAPPAVTVPEPVADVPAPERVPEPGVALDEPAAPRRGWLTLALLLLILIGGAAAILWNGRERSDEFEEGLSLFAEERYADAASHFWLAAEADPDDVVPQLYLARIHRRMQRPDLAEEALAMAEQIAPGDAAIAAERGLLLLDADSAEAALSQARAALRDDAESTEGWIGLVRSLWETNQIPEARQAVEDAPEDIRPALEPPADES